MQFRTLLLIAIVALTAGFAALNWAQFTTPVELSLGLGTIYAPIGAIMLVPVAEIEHLIDARRQAKELQASRELADRAEASRFTELRAFMTAELQRVTQANDAAQERVIARIEQLEQRSRMLTEQTGNTLAAYIGELEDRMAPAGARAAEGRGALTHEPAALRTGDDIR